MEYHLIVEGEFLFAFKWQEIQECLSNHNLVLIVIIIMNSVEGMIINNAFVKS